MTLDAVVVGSGPNGLAAALTLAMSGLQVRVYEAGPTPGGGCRTAELTLPGFRHDVCSAVHPLALASPFLRTLPLADLGVRLLQPEVALAHPLDSGRAATVTRSVDDTAGRLGADRAAYLSVMRHPSRHWQDLVDDLLSPLRRIPRHPVTLGRFGLAGIQSAQRLAQARFETESGQALFAGIAAHSVLPLTTPGTAAYGILLGMLAHAVGWPVVEGGSERLVDAMVRLLHDHGGEVVVGEHIDSLSALPKSRMTLLDVTPRQFVAMAGTSLGTSYQRRVSKFKHGPGVFKVDWALSEPVPWAADGCRAAGTVHVGGPLAEVAESEAAAAAGRHADRPFVLVAQPGVVDATRAPLGQHTLWGYCHVPSGSTVDMTDRIEAQIERFAPGFRDVVLARSTRDTAALEAENSNYIGGDIGGGAQTIRQTFLRPVMQWDPYATPIDGVFLCSSSTPPGGGVHGMCGHLAARSALRHVVGGRGNGRALTNRD